MGSFRPKGFVNPYKISVVNPIPAGSEPTAFSAFEAGADAMLEALRGMGTRSDIKEEGNKVRITVPEIKYSPPCTVVVIPDDE